MSVVIDVAKKLVNKNEVGISAELKKNLKLKSGEKVEVNIATPPKSMNFIKKKMDGKILNRKEIEKGYKIQRAAKKEDKCSSNFVGGVHVTLAFLFERA